MDIADIGERGLVLLGCGKMGTALLSGWLSRGLAPDRIWVRDPAPSDWLREQAEKGIHLDGPLPETPALVLVAVKPQMMETALPDMAHYGAGETVFLSIAAGTPLAYFERMLGAGTPVVRAMPNTPAAVGRGIAALSANAAAGERGLVLAETLLSAVGRTVRLESEAQMDAVTGVSGSGPAYVFHLIESLAAGGEAEGLSQDLAMQLATATVAGAAHLAETSMQTPAELRENVTSPQGTTAAALEVLMDQEAGLPPLVRRAVGAAADRARELGA